MTIGTMRIILLASTLATAAAGAAQTSDGKPRFNHSLAMAAAKDQARAEASPLYARAKAALVPNSPAFATAGERRLSWVKDGRAVIGTLDARTMQAMSRSCRGPFPVDAGRDWVQLSYVCRVDAASPLAGIMTFRDSPELAMTLFFERDRVRAIQAVQPLPIPGQRLLAMDAYEAAGRAGR